MEFRTPKESERDQVESLWAYCFEPKGHPFFEWYFKNCYEPENILVGVESGQVLTDVHLRQYNLNIRGAVLPTTYIVGVATHPAARRGGVGGELLLSSLTELKRRGQAINILMPSKAAFYQQYGWDLYCHQWVQTMKIEDLRPLTDKTVSFGLLNSVDQWELLAPVYEEYTKNLSGYAVRSEADWRRLLGSLFNEGAQVAVVKNPTTDAIEGYLVYTLGAPEIMVSEFVYTSRRGQKGLLNYLYNHRSQGETVRWNEGLHDEGYIFQPNGKEGHSTMPFMMSRIVDVKTAIEKVPGTTSVQRSPYILRLAVQDPLAKWNEGIFEIIYGRKLEVKKLTGALPSSVVTDAGITYESSDSNIDGAMGGVDSKPEHAYDAAITVGGLSLLLMGRMTASELVFEGKLSGDETAIKFLNSVYPKCKTYINEWW